MLRVIVSGSRWATLEEHWEFIGSVLQPICVRDAGVLAHGGGGSLAASRGVDLIAADLARTWGWQVKEIPARWPECDFTVSEQLGGCPDWPHRKRRGPGGRGPTYCPRAGLRRNQQLVDLKPCADLVVAFPDQRGDKSGTGDLIRRAKRAGYDLQVHQIEVVIPRG